MENVLRYQFYWNVKLSNQVNHVKPIQSILLLMISSASPSIPTAHSLFSQAIILDNQTPLNTHQQLAFRLLLNSISSSYVLSTRPPHVSRRGLTTHRCVARNGFQSRLQLSPWKENRERILWRHLSRDRHFHM